MWKRRRMRSWTGPGSAERGESGHLDLGNAAKLSGRKIGHKSAQRTQRLIPREVT